jgi:hypothetical protein
MPSSALPNVFVEAKAEAAALNGHAKNKKPVAAKPARAAVRKAAKSSRR